MMISGGENIQPEEIEAALCNQLGVIRSVVVSEADAEFGHRPVAFVETEGPLAATALRDALRDTLPGFKIPKRIEPWPKDAPEGGIKANRAWFRDRLA
jgi:o-succinylbenzoate---CoA ligase